MAPKTAKSQTKKQARQSPQTWDHLTRSADKNISPVTDSRPRLVLDQDGFLYHVNEAFASYFPAGQKDLIGRKAQDLISILFDRDEQAPASFSDIQAGRYDLALPGFNLIKSYQFDWIDRPEGERYLVASELEEAENDTSESIAEALPEWLETTIEDADERLSARPFNQVPDEEPQGKETREKENNALKSQELKTPLTPAEERRADDPWQFLNLSSEIMVVLHDNGALARVNKAFNDLLVIPEADLSNTTLFDFIHEDDKSEVRHSIQALAHGDIHERDIIEFEIRMIGTDDKIHWLEWRMSLRGDMIYAVGHDLTAEKDHERALQKREQELSEAQEIGRMGHWHWEVGSTEIEWSRQIYRIFGVDEDEFHPTMENVNALLHKRDVGRLLQAFQRAIIEQNTYDMDFRVNKQDGSITHIRCEGRCEIDEDGEVVALFGIMQDITERVNNEKVLREAKDSAERAYAAKSQFLANMSHELRTPLNAIIGFSEMMQRQLLGPIGTEKYLDYIAGIRESGEHLLDLISDILDMSKIEAGKYRLDLEPLNFSKTVRMAIHMMEGRAVESAIKLDTKLPDEDLQINADRRALMQILLNIISNAVKFTNEGGNVTVEALQREHYLSIKVRDNGVGIPPNKLSSIIRPFEQVSGHYSREHQGSGLGLAITKELVELHNGTLSIDSEVGQGTTVTVRLPYDASEKKIAKAKK